MKCVYCGQEGENLFHCMDCNRAFCEDCKDEYSILVYIHGEKTERVCTRCRGFIKCCTEFEREKKYYKCEDCGKIVCELCIHKCDECEIYICEECRHFCDEEDCGARLCADCLIHCECGCDYCSEHYSVCDICLDEYICERCDFNCIICDKSVCEGCCTYCSLCGGNICELCAKENLKHQEHKRKCFLCGNEMSIDECLNANTEKRTYIENLWLNKKIEILCCSCKNSNCDFDELFEKLKKKDEL